MGCPAPCHTHARSLLWLRTTARCMLPWNDPMYLRTHTHLRHVPVMMHAYSVLKTCTGATWTLFLLSPCARRTCVTCLPECMLTASSSDVHRHRTYSLQNPFCKTPFAKSRIARCACAHTCATCLSGHILPVRKKAN